MSANTLLTSVITGGSNNHATTAEEANAVATDFITAGVVGTIGLNAGSGGTGSFCVNADTSPDMGVTILSGQAYIAAAPSGQNSQMLRVRAATSYTAYTINANASGSTKYDWIYLTISATNANTPSADGSNVASFVTSRSSSNTSDNGTPPTYGLLLAVVTVANGASSITNGNIQDKRVAAAVTVPTASTSGWTSLGQPLSTVTANGNRSYSCVFNGVDLTGTLSPGMRVRFTRTTPAPTQCTSLNGTTQYYSKTSPAGMTFTNNFVVSSWIKLTSYAQGMIVSRFDGTSGWYLQVLATGQLQLAGVSGGAGNYSAVTSQAAIPLNKWVHVAAQLDMATFTATSTTSYTMIDGLDAAAAVTRGGTNPTSLLQAGSLFVGAYNSTTPTLFFPGKIAQAAVYSAKVTQANILATKDQGLAGTETNLISAYSFNNSINDLNGNGNNLTAVGSAVATNADSPFGGQAGGTISATLDYGIIQSVTFSTNTTLVVQVPEGCTIPTTGGVNAVSYSTQRTPYGFPGNADKWTIQFILGAGGNSTGSGAWAFPGNTQITLPPGSWPTNLSVSITTASGSDVYTGLLPATTTPPAGWLTVRSLYNTTAGTYVISNYLTYNLTVAAQTTYYVGVRTNAGTINIRGVADDTNAFTQITAYNGYL